MQSFDVLIIGAGIAGASLAWQLARAGRQVLLLERESQPGMHSTGRSAAMFMESYGPPGVRALTRASRAFYLSPPPGFAEAPLLTPRPTLYVATAAQDAALDSLAHTLAASGAPLQWLHGAEQIAACAPALKPGLFTRALLDTHSYDIEAHALLHAYLRGARQAGASLRLNAEPAAAHWTGDAWQVQLKNMHAKGAPTDEPPLRARTVVNAAGAWADELAALWGAAPVGLQPKRRSAFTFRAPEGANLRRWAMVCDVDEQWYYKPDAGQLLGSPANADPVAPHDVQAQELDIALGIHRLQEVADFDIRRPTAAWAGLRSFVADGDMVIGFDHACPRFFWLAAQGGYGIQSAAGASALAASLIQAQPLPAELAAQGVNPAALSPQRLRPSVRP